MQETYLREKSGHNEKRGQGRHYANFENVPLEKQGKIADGEHGERREIYVDICVALQALQGDQYLHEKQGVVMSRLKNRVR